MFFKKKREKNKLEQNVKIAKIKSIEELQDFVDRLREDTESIEENDKFSIKIEGDNSYGTGDLAGTSENLLKGLSILVKMLMRDTDIDEYDIREAVREGIDAEHIKIAKR